MKACLPLFAILLAGCSPITQISTWQGTVGVPAECCEPKTTAEEGIRDAEYDLAEKEFHIFRYDMPGLRTGAWSEYEVNYEEFGISEHTTEHTSTSLEYCKAYNALMDNALKKKFGGNYLRKRDKILPPKGAGKFDAQKRQSEAMGKVENWK